MTCETFSAGPYGLTEERRTKLDLLREYFASKKPPFNDLIKELRYRRRNGESLGEAVDSLWKDVEEGRN